MEEEFYFCCYFLINVWKFLDKLFVKRKEKHQEGPNKKEVISLELLGKKQSPNNVTKKLN